jgi:hypothetical protein
VCSLIAGVHPCATQFPQKVALVCDFEWEADCPFPTVEPIRVADVVFAPQLDTPRSRSGRVLCFAQNGQVKFGMIHPAGKQNARFLLNLVH